MGDSIHPLHFWPPLHTTALPIAIRFSHTPPSPDLLGRPPPRFWSDSNRQFRHVARTFPARVDPTRPAGWRSTHRLRTINAHHRPAPSLTARSEPFPDHPRSYAARRAPIRSRRRFGHAHARPVTQPPEQPTAQSQLRRSGAGWPASRNAGSSRTPAATHDSPNDGGTPPRRGSSPSASRRPRSPCT